MKKLTVQKGERSSCRFELILGTHVIGATLRGVWLRGAWNRLKIFRLYQKAREGCGCFWGLCGSSGGKFRENSGKIAGKIFPNREMLQILGFRAPGKANLPGTLGPHCRDLVVTFRAGCFMKSTVPAFSSFSDCRNSESRDSWRWEFRKQGFSEGRENPTLGLSPTQRF